MNWIFLYFFFIALSNDIDKELSSSGLGLNHGMGRITGSASIETLVRVGIEKEHGLSVDSKMVVLHDFTPCVDDELEVKRGQIVNILYRENDWVYVIGQDTRQEGFIPHSYTIPYNTQLAEMAIKKKLPRDQSLGQSTTITADLVPEIPADILDESSSGLIGIGVSLKHSSQGENINENKKIVERFTSEPDFLPFVTIPSGRYIVLYTFIARDENDVSVERGEFVTVLNREDVDWFWIVRSDGQEGFIPSGFVYPAENILQGHGKSAIGNITSTAVLNGSSVLPVSPTNNNLTNNNINNSNSNNNNNNNTNLQQQMLGSDDLRYHGTELVMLYDYKVRLK